ncbi:MAG: ATP-binding protein, partial [Akkermansia sp.]|nr:ATP-binding protein [Akkermansia sp.]
MRISQLEDEESLGSEGPKLEYKCSFVYTRNGELDIDRQLGYELMRHVAGFMNSEGGLLCIGYYDDGSIRGINEDLQYINTSNEDHFIYELTEDKIKLKFINTIVQHLGKLAGSKVDIELQQNSKGRLVCFLRVAPSARPVWLNGKDLFIRCYNSVRLLRGPEITDYICERCGVALPAVDHIPAAPLAIALPQKEATTPVAAGSQWLVDLSPAEEDEQPWRYISLYADGCVSQQKQPAEEADVLFNVPVSKNHCKKSDRLLLCYDNGCVNVLNPKDVLDKKLTKMGKRYANGYNTEDGVRLMHACVCHEDDYLVLRSRKANGMEMVKAVCVAPYKVHNAQSMHTKGNTFVKTEWAQPVSMRVVPAAHTSFIYNIISKASDKYGPGHSVEAPFCADALAYLEKRRQMEQQG